MGLRISKYFLTQVNSTSHERKVNIISLPYQKADHRVVIYPKSQHKVHRICLQKRALEKHQ